MSNAMRLVVVVLAFTLVSTTALAGAANATTGGPRYNSLAQIIDYTNQNVLKRMQLVFDADILLEVSQASGKGIFSPERLDSRKAAEILDAAKRAGLGNVITATGEERIVKIYAAENAVTKYGTKEIKGVTILKEGDETWGWRHIEENHIVGKPDKTTFPIEYGVTDREKIKEIIGETISKGERTPIAGKPGRYSYTYEYFEGKPPVYVVVDNGEFFNGAIVTAYPKVK